ncbi:uncharacterized protein F5891DRAFT_1056972 [Suillus fuscotomentosus]|uniref:F-box domain-containing protein n=1 Tax=Suillus fuscotomentosus TaxID=1912939 RepID=A0AAD4DXA4_9AGAM|nr:uncharacterized protein F5891DRAFT_1056972 [Suillus fuscotomentosus]KAG1895795.1 hypothetical protein F5891DRAFT_1056972 [Suillus fuscotomentosus]
MFYYTLLDYFHNYCHSKSQVKIHISSIYHFTMLRNFIKSIVNTSLSCAEKLRDRKKFGVHGDLHSRPCGGTVLLVSPIPLPTPPDHFSNTDTPLSSIIDTEDAVCRGQMPSRIGTPTLEGMPDEIQCHILGFLSYNEIIRCSLTCLTLYNTVKGSVELQYIIELGAQRLIEVHPRSPTTSLADCLSILRKKANAWNNFKPIATDAFRVKTLFDLNSVVHRNIISCTPSVHVDAASNTVDIKTNSTCTAKVVMNPNPVPHTYRYMDESQDIEVIITFPIDVDSNGFKYRVSFRSISTGEEHPLSHGSRVVGGRAACSEAQFIKIAVAVFDDRLAVYIAGLDEMRGPCWSLHVLSWQRPSQADDLCVIGDGTELLDIRFLVKEKLIALSTDGHIHLYDTEDPSKAPRLHARFMMPVHGKLGVFDHPSNFHSATSCADLAVPVDHWIWATNPADRVISVTWADPSSMYIVSAHIFFMDVPSTWFDATSEDGRSVKWSSWGPQNSRLVPDERFGMQRRCFFGVGGSRVIWAGPVADRSDSSFQLYMTDFNPSVVARGIGKVVRGPTTSVGLPSDMQVSTYLPFVEVSHDEAFDAPLWDIKLDEETMVEWKMQADVFEM